MYILIKSIQIINLLRGKKSTDILTHHHVFPQSHPNLIIDWSGLKLAMPQVSPKEIEWFLQYLLYTDKTLYQRLVPLNNKQYVPLEFHPHHLMIWYVFEPLLHHFAPNHTLNCARRGTCIRRPSIYQTKVGMYPIISQKKTGKPNFIKHPAISPFVWMVLAILKW